MPLFAISQSQEGRGEGNLSFITKAQLGAVPKYTINNNNTAKVEGFYLTACLVCETLNLSISLSGLTMQNFKAFFMQEVRLEKNSDPFWP